LNARLSESFGGTLLPRYATSANAIAIVTIDDTAIEAR
jgi:hypothetical protein